MCVCVCVGGGGGGGGGGCEIKDSGKERRREYWCCIGKHVQ